MDVLRCHKRDYKYVPGFISYRRFHLSIAFLQRAARVRREILQAVGTVQVFLCCVVFCCVVFLNRDCRLGTANFLHIRQRYGQSASVLQHKTMPAWEVFAC